MFGSCTGILLLFDFNFILLYLISYIKQSAVYCSPIANEENAEWNKTQADGQPVNGRCINIGYDGIISRTCIQSGSIGNWSSISGSCDGIDF